MGDSSEDELYSYAGCYDNNPIDKFLSDGPYNENPMSAEICYKLCTKGAIRNSFNYFGTQKEGDCFCGNIADIERYDTRGYKLNKSERNSNCRGSDNDKCGLNTMCPITHQLANNALLAGIGIGVSCLVVVAICCVIISRRRFLGKQNRERSNTYRNAADMSVTSNQNEQRQGNSFSYTELIVYNHNHAYDDLQNETNDTIIGKAEVLDNSEDDLESNDNYTVLVVPEDQNSTLATHTTGFIENLSDNKASNKTNPTIGAYAILDPKETGFDRTNPEQEIKVDSYAVLVPAETGFDRTKDKDEEPIQLLKHENWDKALHATANTETRDDMKNQNGGAHSITMKNKIESIENKADKKASKKTNIGTGAYAILDPDATDFDRTKPEPEVNDDPYTVLDPAETGFDRTKHRDDIPSESVNIKNSGKAIHGHDIQNEITNGEGNHSLNMDGQYDLLNQKCRPQDDNEHTYSHSVDEVYDITNQNRTLRSDDSLNAYDHFIGSKTSDDNNDKTAVING
ncbi:unnamed protein product [Mytilus edulis]|uniref:WSC domain-containing protein n=1 Tax=Mytilus edulis TaxID=6550 RepID=A0A8S3U8B3_MYTED|nr:unnamed protein product [Mytilus edulis]